VRGPGGRHRLPGAQVIGEEAQITVIPEGETVTAAASEQRVG